MLDQVDIVTSEQGERRVAGTVACIDVRLASIGAGRSDISAKSAVVGFALHQIQGAVRADDRICPMGTSRLAVEFGPVASGVLPQVLGDRLARAVGQSMPSDSSTAGLAVSVGMAAPEPHLGPSDLTRRALSAAQAGSSQLGRGSSSSNHVSNTMVTVDWLLTPRSSGSSSEHVFQSIHRRRVYRYEAGRIRGMHTLRGTRCPPGEVTVAGIDMRADMAVLVVDPMASRSGEPGTAAMTVASTAERLGCRTAVFALSVEDPLELAVDGVPLDVVLLVLDGGWMNHSPVWSTGAWGKPAQVTALYQAAGVQVLAVSTGAGAGAVASCVAQGALALFSLDGLADALRSLQRFPDDEIVQVAEMNLSPLFRALVGLTASERRVLFYLTEGRGAQEIADELVVSVATVRSHIRSILRKLGVRSQLAAVAIANSRDLEHSASGEAAS
jgi:DNA-binding CsgD family transcriptional regulator